MHTTRRQLLSFSGALVATALVPRLARADAPDDIVAHADEIRNPIEPYFLHMTIESTGADDPWEIEVSSRSNRQCLVSTLKPMREHGRKLLMVDEDMWAFMPNLKRSVRVALNQKLVGQAANGDITRTQWGGDYAATIEAETPKDWRLLLTAKKKGLTYEKLRLWVEKGSYRPLHVDCLNLSGRPLKTMTYGGFRDLCGKVRPSTVTIVDAVRTSDQSVLRVQSMELRKFPDSMFTPESLQ